MPLKNSNTVAVERRVDLASLFCMIGRHGPAVALAVIAMVSVLAGFIIYRTVRGKRRKATADGGGDVSPAAEECHSPEEATGKKKKIKKNIAKKIYGSAESATRRGVTAGYRCGSHGVLQGHRRGCSDDEARHRNIVL